MDGKPAVVAVLWAVRHSQSSEELAHIRRYLLQGGRGKPLFPSTPASDLTGKVRNREEDVYIGLFSLTASKMEKKRVQASSLYSS